MTLLPTCLWVAACSSAAATKTPSVAFEILYGALVLFGRLTRTECAKVTPLAGFRVGFTRVESILAALEFSYHGLTLLTPGMPIADAVNIRDRNPWPSVTANRLSGRQFLSHLQVMLQRRQRPTGPILEFRIVTACRIAFEQRNRVLVTAHLI